jgi:hypothetical protein
MSHGRGMPKTLEDMHLTIDKTGAGRLSKSGTIAENPDEYIILQIQIKQKKQSNE